MPGGECVKNMEVVTEKKKISFSWRFKDWCERIKIICIICLQVNFEKSSDEVIN